MIKKNIKKWYPTKKQENQAALMEKILLAATSIHNIRFTNPPANYVIVGTDAANILNDATRTYLNQWCGTTFTTTTAVTSTTNICFSSSTSTISFSG